MQVLGWSHAIADCVYEYNLAIGQLDWPLHHHHHHHHHQSSAWSSAHSLLHMVPTLPFLVANFARVRATQ